MLKHNKQKLISLRAGALSLSSPPKISSVSSVCVRESKLPTMLHLFQVGLVASGLAAAVVSAQDLLPFPLQHPQLQPRQYFSEAPTSIASQCLVAFSSLASSVPTPPADLGSWLSDFMFTARPGCYASYPLPATSRPSSAPTAPRCSHGCRLTRPTSTTSRPSVPTNCSCGPVAPARLPIPGLR